jgi:P4 family phage/plasmid primase-like protien
MFLNYINNFADFTNKTNQLKQTHLSLINGKYNVPAEKIEEFNLKYFNTIKEGKEKLYLVEKITNSNFAFFLDIEVPKNIDEELNDENILLILEKTNIVIKKYIIDENNINIDITENIISKRIDENNKPRYHINYYNLVLNNNTAIILSSLIVENLPINYKKTIDKSVYSTGLRMLGSYKQQINTPHLNSIYRIYNINTALFLENSDFTYAIFSKTSILRLNNKDESVFKIKEELLNDVLKAFLLKKGAANNAKSNFMDANLENDIVKHLKNLKQTHSCLEHYDIDKRSLKSIKTIQTESTDKSSLKEYRHFINILEEYCPFKERCHQRKSSPIFIEINKFGTFIKCHDIDCKGKRYPHEGIPFPITFESDCPYLYKSIKLNYVPSELGVLPEHIQILLEQSLVGTHYLISKAIFNIYKEKYRVDNIKTPEWYEFDGIRWKKSYSFNIMLSEEIPRYYKSLITVEQQKEKENEDEDEDNSNSRFLLVKKIIRNLENVSFKKNIIEQCIQLFKNYDQYFYERLDTNPYLIGFKNGIYDLEKKQFRKGKLDDYLTFSTGYDYIEFNEIQDSDEIKDIDNFIGKIVPNKNVKQFLYNILARGLLGIVDEKFYIFTGLSGSNGKSTLMNFLEYVLGDYMASVDSSLLTNKKGLSSSASPEIIKLKGSRLCSIQEPEENASLQTGILKQFTGGDTITARELYKAPISFKLQASWFLCCNQTPMIQNLEGGIIRRLRIIEFNSKFCEIPKGENEFNIDPDLKNKLKYWKAFFMSFLIYTYNKNGKTFEEPEEVTLFTKNYMTDNNKFDDYFNERIVLDNSSFESLKNIYNDFIDYWTHNNKNEKIPKLLDFKTHIRLLYGNEKTFSGTLRKGYNLKFKETDGLYE